MNIVWNQEDETDLNWGRTLTACGESGLFRRTGKKNRNTEINAPVLEGGGQGQGQSK